MTRLFDCQTRWAGCRLVESRTSNLFASRQVVFSKKIANGVGYDDNLSALTINFNVIQEMALTKEFLFV
jgi:hypothetical protein